MEIRSPTDGLLICTATHPFVTTGTPIGHLLPISKGIKSVKRRLDDEGVLVLSGADGEPPWREDDEIEANIAFGYRTKIYEQLNDAS